MHLGRRDLLIAATLPALAWVTRARAWASPLDHALLRWLRRLHEIGHAVRAGQMSPADWQAAMQELYRDLSPTEIVSFIDMDRLLAGLRYPEEKLGAVVRVEWPEIEAAPGGRPLTAKLFVYRKGSMTPPHVHNHAVSAHWVVRGEIRTRTFDRVEDLESAILLRPTRDETSRPGTLVTMSDARDNGHWFEGRSELAISFDIPISGIEPEKQYRHPDEDSSSQIFVDPTLAPRADGMIEAPIMKFVDSVRKFA
jgi:hypothetical protein